MAKRMMLWFLLTNFLTFTTPVFAQNQHIADSLKLVLQHTRDLSSKLELANKIAYSTSSPDEKLKFSGHILKWAEDPKFIEFKINAYQYQGLAFRMKGDLKRSLENLFESAKLAMSFGRGKLLAEVYLEIATTYTSNNQLSNALVYEKKAIAIIREEGNAEQLAINLLNTGYVYYRLLQLDSALMFYNEAELLFDSVGLEIGKAYTIGNRALVYWKQGDGTVAEQDLLKAIAMLDPLGDQYGMADYHNQLGQLYAEQTDFTLAIHHTSKALIMAEALDLKEQIRDASRLLSELYATEEDYQRAFTYQNQYLTYKDSIENTETTKKMADLRTEFEVNLREKEIDLLEERQLLNRFYIAIAVILLVFAIVVLLYFRQRFRNTKLIAAQERRQHDEKIINLLNVQETKALQSMVKGQESERKRLAQELHNHFGSLLATIKVNINGIDEDAIPNHGTLTALIDQACTDIRNASHELNMGVSNDFGLVPALKELTRHLQQANQLEVEFTATMCQELLGSEDEIIIYRIIQELVSNVLRHAAARKLSILLTCFAEENLVNILVQDDGRGFDAETIDDSRSGIGLKSLVSMIKDLNGEITFDSNQSSGTTVNIDLPITNASLDK